MVRKQLNLSLTLEQYKWLEELAQEAGETPTKYARHIVLDAISPAPETDLNSGVLVLPFWLAHFLLFLVLRGRRVRQLRHRGPSEPLPCLEAPGARTGGVRLLPGERDPPVEGDGQPQTGGPRWHRAGLLRRYAADGRPAPLGSLLPQAEREKHSTRNPPTTSRSGPTQPILHFVHYTVYIVPL